MLDVPGNAEALLRRIEDIVYREAVIVNAENACRGRDDAVFFGIGTEPYVHAVNEFFYLRQVILPDKCAEVISAQTPESFAFSHEAVEHLGISEHQHRSRLKTESAVDLTHTPEVQEQCGIAGHTALLDRSQNGAFAVDHVVKAGHDVVESHVSQPVRDLDLGLVHGQDAD